MFDSKLAFPDGVFSQKHWATHCQRLQKMLDASAKVQKIVYDMTDDAEGTAGEIDHGLLAGLTDDDHTQYLLLAGRSGGQTAIGGTGSGDDITIQSTSHATKGSLIFSDYLYATFQNSTDSTTAFQVLDAGGGVPVLNVDTVTEQVGIGTASPAATLHVLNIEDNAAVTIFNLEGKRPTPANNDTIYIYYRMNNDTPASFEYARTTITAEDITTGDEEGSLLFEIARAGSLETALKMSATEIVLNEPGADRDFRVEASGVADAIEIQGSDGQITLGALGAGVVHSTAGGVLSSSTVDISADTNLAVTVPIVLTDDTLSFNINGLAADTIAAADELIFYDSDGADHNKITFANLEGTLSHDALANFVAQEHINWTSASEDFKTTGYVTAGTFGLLERSSDPDAPAEGEAVIWMSDGTGKGDDGDILVASNAGGVTNWTTLFDHSAGAGW
jgi:hypothetical protein